jgi:CubicO group peptidase (beta-lactamase class C family)
VNDARFEPVLREMQRQVDAAIRPALQVAVCWRGRLVLDAAAGGATPRSSFLLWSATKPFVAVALLQQIDAGRASLDDRVERWIPEFGRSGKAPATLAHVLSHRGGFPENLSPDLARALWRLRGDPDELLRFVCEMQALWEPGTDRGYHGLSGWTIVGELVQRLSGRPLRDALRALVLDPLGIEADGFALGEPERLAEPPLAVRTRGERGDPPESEAQRWNDPVTQRALLPGATGVARAREALKLYSALLRGGAGENGPVLSPRMVRTATFPHAVGIRDRTFLVDVPWGLGFHLKHVRPSLDDCGETATPGTFGHAGHFIANTAWADPAKDLCAVLLTNGLVERRAGFAAVKALSQSIHDVVDALVDSAR